MQPRTPDGRPLPLIAPIARPYFVAALEGELRLQKCPRDGFFFYPRSHCPRCLRTDWSWQSAAPRGHIYSFTIDRMGQEPGLRSRTPFAIAVVDLADGPRVPGIIIESDLRRLRVGLPVNVAFDLIGGAPLMVFRLSDS